MHLNLHLTDDTQLRAHGFLAASGLFAEVQWDLHGPFADSPGDGVLWGTPDAMRRLAELRWRPERDPDGVDEERRVSALSDTVGAVVNPSGFVGAMFIACLSVLLGLVAELTVRTYYESQGKRTYSVRETVGGS